MKLYEEFPLTLFVTKKTGFDIFRQSFALKGFVGSKMNVKLSRKNQSNHLFNFSSLTLIFETNGGKSLVYGYNSLNRQIEKITRIR